MTNKDYKKKYEDANKRVATRFGSDVARELFPDLYESEDERIRKTLIRIFKKADMGGKIFGEGITYKQVVAWLEKQGEKLPVGFYYVNSEGKKFYSDTFKYGDFTFHVEKQDEQIPANSAKPCQNYLNNNKIMEKEDIINYLIEEKAINDYEDDCPFVGTYLDTILELSKKIEIKMIEKACEKLVEIDLEDEDTEDVANEEQDPIYVLNNHFIKKFKEAMEDDI